MRIKGISEEMLFLVGVRVGLGTGLDEGLGHDTMFHGETVFAVVHQADSIISFGKVSPLMAADLEFRQIPAGILMDLSCEVTKLDIISGFICMYIDREMDFQKVLAEFPVHIGLKIDPSVLTVEMDLLTDHGTHQLSLYQERCPYRTVFQPLHGTDIFHTPGFFLMENIGVPVAVAERFVLVNPKLVSNLTLLKHLAVVFLIEKGGELALIVDDDAVEGSLQGEAALRTL